MAPLKRQILNPDRSSLGTAMIREKHGVGLTDQKRK